MAAPISDKERDKIRDLLIELGTLIRSATSSSTLLGKSAQDLADHFGSGAEAIKAINREINGLVTETQTLDNVFGHIVEQMQKAAASGTNYRTIQGQINTLADRMLDAKRKEEKIGKEQFEQLKKLIQLRLSEVTLTDDVRKNLEAILELTEKIKEEQDKEEKAAAARKKIYDATLGKLKSMFDNFFSMSTVVSLIKDTIFSMDAGITKVAKGLNLSYKDSKEIYQNFQRMANSSGDLAIRASTLSETLVSINQSLGIATQLNEKQLMFMTKLREKAGFTNEELNKMYLLTAATGQDQEKFTASFLASARIASNRAGIALNEKKLLQDTLNISKAIQLSFGGNADALARAATEAKKVGISMEKLEGIASSLLDFESSISAELEAEVLTGRNLNLEMARVYAINNDIEGLSREIGKNYGTIDNFLNSNRLQQEAMAKAVGMTREELAGSLLEAKAIGNATGEEAQRRREAYEFAKQRYGEEEAAKMLAEGQLETLENQMGVQERFAAGMEKLKEIFAEIAGGPLLSIVEGLADMLKNTAVLKTVVVALAATFAAMAVSSIATAVAVSGGVAALTIGAGIAAAVGSFIALNSGGETAQPVGDMYIPPAMGNDTPQISLGKGQRYKIAPQDGMAIVAGPETRGGQAQPAGPSKTDQLLERLIQVTANKNLNIDSQRFAAVASTSDYKVGSAYS